MNIEPAPKETGPGTVVNGWEIWNIDGTGIVWMCRPMPSKEVRDKKWFEIKYALPSPTVH